MTYFIKNGNTFRPTDEQNVDIRTLLPPANYIIKEDQYGNLFFEIVGSFEFKGKRYGENIRWTKRILDTCLSRPAGTGVMLTGEKGSGKSLLAKTVSMEGIERDMPTIVINAPWRGDKFNALIQSIQQPAIVLFDEFEKVYNSDQQEEILTLLDGVFPTQKLFMFTCNDKWRVDRHMRNRPGRIFYMVDFTGLTTEFIEEYCNDNLHNKSHIQTICKITGLFSQFNFDMLKALVEEMNRYDENPTDALAMLNVRPEFDEGKVAYTVNLFKNDIPCKLYRTEWTGNPLMTDVEIHYQNPTNKKAKKNVVSGVANGGVDNIWGDEADDADDVGFDSNIRFTPDYLTSITTDNFTYRRDDMMMSLVKKVVNQDRASWLGAF